MPAASPQPITNIKAGPSGSPRMQCAQVYGGTEAKQIDVELPGMEGFLYSQPCQSQSGGDIYYMSVCGSGVLSRFCVADVVGHGADVAVVSAETHTLLRKSINWTDHRRVLRQLNRALVEKGLQSMTTAAMFTYYPPTRKLSFSYAGHPPAWRYSVRQQQWEQLVLPDTGTDSSRTSHGSRDASTDDRYGDIPLAVDADTVFSRGTVKPDSGDLVVVTTDGVSDALNSASERFGDSGLAAALRSVDHPTPQNVADRIVERLREFRGEDRFTHDDITILALRTLHMSRLEALRAAVSNRLLRPLTGGSG